MVFIKKPTKTYRKYENGNRHNTSRYHTSLKYHSPYDEV